MGFFYIALKNILVQKEKSLVFFLIISLTVSITLLLLFIVFGIRNNLKTNSNSMYYPYTVKMPTAELKMTYRGVLVGQNEVRDIEDFPSRIVEYLKSIPSELKLKSIDFQLVQIMPYKDKEIIIVGEFSPLENQLEKLDNQALSAGYLFNNSPEIKGTTLELPGNQEVRVTDLLEQKGTEEDNILIYSIKDLSRFNIIKLTSKLISIEKVQNILDEKFPGSLIRLEVSGVNSAANLRSTFFEKLINYFGYIIILMIIPILLLFNVFGLSIVRGKEIEIAVLMALGFKKKDIALLVFIELLTMGVASVLSGFFISLLLIYLIQVSGVLSEFFLVINQIPLISGITFMSLLGILLISGIIPLSKATRMDPVTAFRTIN